MLDDRRPGALPGKRTGCSIAIRTPQEGGILETLKPLRRVASGVGADSGLHPCARGRRSRRTWDWTEPAGLRPARRRHPAINGQRACFVDATANRYSHSASFHHDLQRLGPSHGPRTFSGLVSCHVRRACDQPSWRGLLPRHAHARAFPTASRNDVGASSHGIRLRSEASS